MDGCCCLSLISSSNCVIYCYSIWVALWGRRLLAMTLIPQALVWLLWVSQMYSLCCCLQCRSVLCLSGCSLNRLVANMVILLSVGLYAYVRLMATAAICSNLLPELVGWSKGHCQGVTYRLMLLFVVRSHMCRCVLCSCIATSVCGGIRFRVSLPAIVATN